MGLFSGLLGNATTVDSDTLRQQLAPILAETETIEIGFQLIRDQFVFTNRRLILIDKQGLTGKKTEYLSVIYRAITRFSVETAGHFDLDADLKIWVSGAAEPIVRSLHGGDNVTAIQQALATAVLSTR
ncbi:PH domain-containing protein [Thiospirillum jenense]|uniref:PH domain-containing protein n=1 Tax=Thiospirillum jenense TaxID=1653858 RepID=A0A839HDA8_9GAMM|nr:PH domain-containing protein [Thiospirillum jenense]MBB1125386.1 PH domain-containing protein [Thiospirillum jenense]